MDLEYLCNLPTKTLRHLKFSFLQFTWMELNGFDAKSMFIKEIIVENKNALTNKRLVDIINHMLQLIL